MKLIAFTTFCIFLALNIANANVSTDWSRDAFIPLGQNRANIAEIEDEKKWQKMIQEGTLHALRYPVEVSGLFIPYGPFKKILSPEHSDIVRDILLAIGAPFTGFRNEVEFYEWLGLHRFNPPDARGIYRIPYPSGEYEEDAFMGAEKLATSMGEGLTFSCATCHSASLFGVSVMGLTNKRSRANELFVRSKKYLPLLPSSLFQTFTGATDQERRFFERTQRNMRAVGVKRPQVLGLDTSLSQVALSLARRNQDPYATKSRFREMFPRSNPLENFVSDSKPAVWWNLKYKTRWLSDGSIVQGNPILTNFLWNELGRGTNLRELENWMRNNRQTIKELTVAAFATKAPVWSDFFDPYQSIDFESAQRGEIIFNESCMKCHGQYEKNWSLPEAKTMTLAEKLETYRVSYHEQTPVINVGTDPQRHQGMVYFAEDLNQLAISKWMDTVVEPQEGYVPPPLVGIWSRYPYFHNNSIPNLCALVTPPHLRPKIFVQGPSDDAETDFSKDCVGYPESEDIPAHWWTMTGAIFNATRPGLSNRGHYSMFLDEDGEELYSWEQKMDLIEFLKTL